MVFTMEEVVGGFLLTEQVLVMITGGELWGVKDRGMEGVELLVVMDIVG